MTRSVKTIAQRLSDAETAIKGTLHNPPILAAVSVYGYNQARMEAALALFEEAWSLTELQHKAYEKQDEATANLAQAWKEADKAYRSAFALAAFVFYKDVAARRALLLNGPRKKRMSSWLEQTRTFYANLLSTPAFLDQLARRYSPEKLADGLALVEAVQAHIELRQIARSEAQAATQLRNKKLRTLDRWLGDYKMVSKLTLDSPRDLEQLGWA
jgi:hypothetical protein